MQVRLADALIAVSKNTAPGDRHTHGVRKTSCREIYRPRASLKKGTSVKAICPHVPKYVPAEPVFGQAVYSGVSKPKIKDDLIGALAVSLYDVYQWIVRAGLLKGFAGLAVAVAAWYVLAELRTALQHSVTWWPRHWRAGLRLLCKNLAVGTMTVIGLTAVYSYNSHHTLPRYFENTLLMLVIFAALLAVTILMIPYDMKERERRKKEKEWRKAEKLRREINVARRESPENNPYAASRGNVYEDNRTGIEEDAGAGSGNKKG